jgi:hypothetical protein
MELSNEFYLGGLDDRGSRVRFSAGAGNFSPHHRVQNGSGAHPASYQMNTRGSFPGGKAVGAWSWPLTPSSAEVKEWVELYLHSSNTPTWRGAQLKYRDNFTFPLPIGEEWSAPRSQNWHSGGSVPVGNRMPLIQSVVNHYTDWS